MKKGHSWKYLPEQLVFCVYFCGKLRQFTSTQWVCITVIAPLAKFIDWSVIQLLTVRPPRDHGPNPRLEEALQFLKGPDFIPSISHAAQPEFRPDKSGLHFRFATPRPCDFAENNVVYGRLYRCGERWQQRPVIILLHGAKDFFNYRYRFPLIARSCNQAGFNAATLVAPTSGGSSRSWTCSARRKWDTRYGTRRLSRRSGSARRRWQPRRPPCRSLSISASAVEFHSTTGASLPARFLLASCWTHLPAHSVAHRPRTAHSPSPFA